MELPNTLEGNAGYANSLSVLTGMYAGGVVYAVVGNITMGLIGQEYGESMMDDESVPYISSGYTAGYLDSMNRQATCP
jgi:hypothetical protein